MFQCDSFVYTDAGGDIFSGKKLNLPSPIPSKLKVAFQLLVSLAELHLLDKVMHHCGIHSGLARAWLSNCKEELSTDTWDVYML